MEPRTVRKATILQMILSGIGALLILTLGLLWNQNYDLIKNVQAQCISLQDKKAEKDDFKELLNRLERIEDKIDRIRK